MPKKKNCENFHKKSDAELKRLRASYIEERNCLGKRIEDDKLSKRKLEALLARDHELEIFIMIVDEVLKGKRNWLDRLDEAMERMKAKKASKA